MRLQVAKIAANGSIRQWVVDTAGRSDAGRWEELFARVPAVPPPYRAAPGSAVYDIRVDDGKFLVGEHDLSGPLSDLVRAVLVEGDAVLAARPKPGTRGHGAATDPALGTGRHQVSVEEAPPELEHLRGGAVMWQPKRQPQCSAICPRQYVRLSPPDDAVLVPDSTDDHDCDA